jgi:hypothetical protein
MHPFRPGPKSVGATTLMLRLSILARAEITECNYPNSLVDLSRPGPKSVGAGYLAP